MSGAAENSGVDASAGRKLRRWARAALLATGLHRTYWYLGWIWIWSREEGLLTSWSRAHNAVFVHIPKNAGTSIAATLGIVRSDGLHAPAIGYRAADRRFYRKAYSFAVVRNPWDRIVSAFHFVKFSSNSPQDVEWRATHLSDIDRFPDFVRRLADKSFRKEVMTYHLFQPQWFFLCDYFGRLIVDDLVRYEELDQEIGRVAERLNLAAVLTHHNASAHRPYADQYDRATKDIVASIYRKDIQLLGYEFEGIRGAGAAA